MIFRNNNPGNIRKVPGVTWLGEIGSDSRGFIIFDTPENGTRAMIKLLYNYTLNGFDTLKKIVFRWAPPNENDSSAYLTTLQNLTGFHPDESISFVNPAEIYNLVSGMTRIEQGIQHFPMTVFDDAWNILFGGSGAPSNPVPGSGTPSGSFIDVLMQFLPFVGFGYLFYKITSKKPSYEQKN